MQPTFNPWIGYFDLIDYVDKFIFFDTVQLNQQSWQTRNKLKIQDQEHFVILPIQKTSSKQNMIIKEAILDFRKFDFRKKLFKTIEQNYRKAKYFNETIDFIKELIFYETNYLSSYNVNIIKQICEKLNIQTELIVLSQTDYSNELSKGDLVLDICKYFKANDYVSPLGSKDYLDNYIEEFKSNNINVEYQYFLHPKYEQLGKVFISYIGIFDLLLNEGFKNSLKIIREGRKYKNS